MSIVAAAKTLAAEVAAAKGHLGGLKVDKCVRELCALANDPSYFATSNEIRAARAQYATSDIQIDDGALASSESGTPGRWVMAWVWVRDE
jgi:hypothetical protein